MFSTVGSKGFHESEKSPSSEKLSGQEQVHTFIGQAIRVHGPATVAADADKAMSNQDQARVEFLVFQVDPFRSNDLNCAEKEIRRPRFGKQGPQFLVNLNWHLRQRGGDPFKVETKRHGGSRNRETQLRKLNQLDAAPLFRLRVRCGYSPNEEYPPVVVRRMAVRIRRPVFGRGTRQGRWRSRVRNALRDKRLLRILPDWASVFCGRFGRQNAQPEAVGARLPEPF